MMIIRIILTVPTCQAVKMREDFLVSFLEKKAEVVKMMRFLNWCLRCRS